MAARSGWKRYFSRGVAMTCLLAATGIAGAVISSGCGDATTTTTTTTPSGPSSSGSKEAIDLTKVKWVHAVGADIASWPVTAKLGKVTFEGGVMVCSDGMSWPNSWSKVGGRVNANHVVLANINGQWYGGAWEAMNAGISRCREMETIAHKQTGKYGPFGQVEQDPFWAWRPQKGEKIGFMITSWIRSGVQRPVGRSNVVMTEWP
jgi:hypothetical protein